MRSRRRSRRSRYQSRNKNKLTFTPVIVILCLSVGCGYAAAKYVVDPVVNYVPQLMAEKEQETAETENGQDITGSSSNSAAGEKDMVEDEVDSAIKDKVAGYALQFGCYSSNAAAEAVMPTIGVAGLQIIEQNDMYKIVGEIYKTKEEAKSDLEELPETVNAFVTTVYE